MSVTFCRKCQGLIEPGQAFCTRCFTVVRQKSLLRRVFGGILEWIGRRAGAGSGAGFDLRSGIVSSSTNITLRTSEKISVHDESSGQMREYSSLDELPPHLREQVEAALQQAQLGGGTVSEQSIIKNITTNSDGHTHKEITVRGPDGAERRYASLDELPPEMRRLFDKLGGA